MRKSLPAIVAVLALALAACGASGDDDDAADTTTTEAESTTTEATEPEETTTTTTEPEGDGVAVEDWAVEFCGNFETWQGDVQAAAEDVQSQVTPGDMESAKTAIVGMLQTASDETQELIGQIEDGGAPDIDDGDQFLEDLVGKFQEFDGAIVAVRDDVDALDAGDPVTFQTEVESLLGTFETEVAGIGDSFQELDEEYPSADLNAAIQSSCNL